MTAAVALPPLRTVALVHFDPTLERRNRTGEKLKALGVEVKNLAPSVAAVSDFVGVDAVVAMTDGLNKGIAADICARAKRAELPVFRAPHQMSSPAWQPFREWVATNVLAAGDDPAWPASEPRPDPTGVELAESYAADVERMKAEVEDARADLHRSQNRRRALEQENARLATKARQVEGLEAELRAADETLKEQRKKLGDLRDALEATTSRFVDEQAEADRRFAKAIGDARDAVGATGEETIEEAAKRLRAAASTPAAVVVEADSFRCVVAALVTLCAAGAMTPAEAWERCAKAASS